MITRKTIPVILLLFLHFSLDAAWNINSNGPKGIYTVNSDRHQLSIVENKDGVDFFLSIHSDKMPYDPKRAIIKVGDLSEKTDKIQLIDAHSGLHTYQLGLGKKQKTTLLNKMISGLIINIDLVNKRQHIRQLVFSLSNFTARLNDFLIVREIGKLDYEWLLENHKDRELLCYYAANIYVKALQDRLGKGNYKSTLESIPKTGIEKLDNVTAEMVENVYSIPARKLPIDPRGDKYGIFRACMSKAN